MELELAEGITLHFELEEYCEGERPSLDSPGEPEYFDFSWTIKIEDITCLDDFEEHGKTVAKVVEGTRIQELMTAEYVEQNQPEPDFD